MSETLVKSWLQIAELPESRKRVVQTADSGERKKVAYEQLKEHRAEKQAAKRVTPLSRFRRQFDQVSSAVLHCDGQLGELVADAKRLQAENVNLEEVLKDDAFWRHVDGIAKTAQALKAIREGEGSPRATAEKRTAPLAAPAGPFKRPQRAAPKRAKAVAPRRARA